MQAHSLSFPAARTSPRVFPEDGPPPPDDRAVPAVLSETAEALAHDAGNLLQSLRLYSGLLAAPGVLQPHHRHYAEEIAAVGERTAALLVRLFDGSLPPSAWAANPPAPTCLSDPAAALLGFVPVLETLARPQAALSAQAGLRIPPLPFAPEVLERILTNLVLNAAEAIAAGPATKPAGGRIRVSLTCSGGFIRLSVEDDGPGIPPAVAAAFLRPEPLPAGARRGLGHRIVHALAMETGGRLSVRDAQAEGRRGSVLSIAWPGPCAPPLPQPEASLPDPALHPANTAGAGVQAADFGPLEPRRAEPLTTAPGYFLQGAICPC